MHVIAVTGNIGSGKSTVAKMFAAYGADIFDADAAARSLLAPGGKCVSAVQNVFGAAVMKRGLIDRKKLAVLVFADSRTRRRLEAIVHPEVKKIFFAVVKSGWREDPDKILIADIPLLFEAHLHRYADWIVVVKAKREQQLTRVMQSLGISRSQAARRNRAQIPLKEKISLADFIIDNTGTTQQTREQVKKVWDSIQKKIQK
ncbi:MAG: dephospho-CoA kinase [Candidatus Omnitrophica bacterium]|nr:dephospho-CoA kinase [Candidatus Omnitrophota bacterium]